MAIEFACSCGKKLKVADAMGGKKVKCPQCQAVRNVPAPSVMMTGIEASPSATNAPVPKPADRKANTVLDEPGEGDLELDMPDEKPKKAPGKPAEAKPAAKAEPKPEAAKPAVQPKPVAEAYDLAGDEEINNAPKPSTDVKRAMTVLDGEEDFEGFGVDEDIPAASLVNKPGPSAPKPAAPEKDADGGDGVPMKEAAATMPVPSRAKAAPPDKPDLLIPAPAAPSKPPPPAGLMDQIKSLPPPALYGGIAAVAALLLLVVWFAIPGDTPPTIAKNPPGGGGGTTTPPGGSINEPVVPDEKKGKVEKTPGTETPKTPAVVRDTAEVERLKKPAPEELAAVAVSGEFWTRYDAVVESGTADRWKAHFEWCKSKGLAAAAEEARRAAAFLDPTDATLRVGATDKFGIAGGGTLFTTPEARARVDAMPARLVVINRAHPSVKLAVPGAAAVDIPQGGRQSVVIRKPGLVKFKITTSAGQSAEFSEFVMPGAGRQIDLLSADRLPRLPQPAFEAAVLLSELAAAAPVSTPMPRLLGPNRLLDITAAKDGTTLRLVGPAPAAPDGITAAVRTPARKPVKAVFKPAADNQPATLTVGEDAAAAVFSISPGADGRPAIGSIQWKRIEYGPPSPKAPAVFDADGRLVSGSVMISGFPLTTEQVCLAMDLDYGEVLSAVERNKFAPLPPRGQLDDKDLLNRVMARPDLAWNLDEFFALCGYLGIAPQSGCTYSQSPIGPVASSGWFGAHLLGLLGSRPDSDVASALAARAADVRAELAAQASGGTSYVRPYAAVLLAWPGNDEAVAPLVRLAGEYVKFAATQQLTDPYLNWLMKRWTGRLDIPETVAAALQNIGTSRAVTELRRLAGDQTISKEFRRACVRALARMGHPEAIQYLGSLVAKPPTDLRNDVLSWIGRWDLKQNRRLVADKLTKGTEGDMIDLAEAAARQAPGEASLYILRMLAGFDCRKRGFQLERVDDPALNAWRWNTRTVLLGESPKEMVKSVCWLLGRRGDLPAAGLLREYLALEHVGAEGKKERNLDLFTAALPPAGRDMPEMLVPTIQPGQLWNAVRHRTLGNAMTIYEEAFGGFRGNDLWPLVSFLITLSVEKAIVERELQPWTVKLLAERGHPAMRQILKLLYGSVLRPEETVEPRTRLMAGLGLLRLGDKDSLTALGKEDMYNLVFDELRFMYIKERNSNAVNRAKEGKEFGGKLVDGVSGILTKAGIEWEAYVEANVWTHIRALFESEAVDPDLRPDLTLTLGTPAFEALFRRLQREYKPIAGESDESAARAGRGGRAGPSATVLKPGTERAMAVSLLTKIVWPTDGPDGGPIDVGNEYRTLQRRALSALLDIARDPALPAKLLELFDKPSVSDLAMRGALRLYPRADPKLIAALLTRAAAEPYANKTRLDIRNQVRNTSLTSREAPLLDAVAGAQGERLSLGDCMPLLLRENYDLAPLLLGDPTLDAIRTLGRIPDKKCRDALAAILEGKPAPEGAYDTLEKAEREMIRRAAAGFALAESVAALAPLDKAFAEESRTVAFQKLSEVLTRTGLFGLEELKASGFGGAGQAEAKLRLRRLMMLVEFKRQCLASMSLIADARCAEALKSALTYSSEAILEMDMTPVRDMERKLNLEALRLLMSVAGPESGSALTDQLFPARTNWLNLQTGATLTRCLMRTVTVRCMNENLAGGMRRVLADDKVLPDYRRWALNNLVLTGNKEELDQLTEYVKSAEFKNLVRQSGGGDAMLTLIQSARDSEGGLTASGSLDFLVRLLRAGAPAAGGPDALLSLAAETPALLGLYENPLPAAGAALAEMRRLPRYRHAAAYLGFARGERLGAAGRDESAVAHLAEFAGEVRRGDAAQKADAGRVIKALARMIHPKSASALMKYVEVGNDPDVRVQAGWALYGMVMEMTRPHSGLPAPEADLSGRIMAVIKDLRVEALRMPLTTALAALGQDAGLEMLAKELLVTPSKSKSDQPEVPFDLHHALLLFDIVAERKAQASGGAPTQGVVALTRAVLSTDKGNRPQPKPLEDPLVAAAAELAARCGVFEERKAPPEPPAPGDTFYLSEIMKKAGWRVAVLESLALFGRNADIRKEAKAKLEEMRDAKNGPLKPLRDEVEEIDAALKRTAKAPVK